MMTPKQPSQQHTTQVTIEFDGNSTPSFVGSMEIQNVDRHVESEVRQLHPQFVNGFVSNTINTLQVGIGELIND